jgi:imidazolonepropionase
MELVAGDWLKKLAKLCDYADIFVDEGFFDTEDGNKLIIAAQKQGLQTKIHADELALTGGTELAVKHGALSCDHLLKISDREVEMLSRAETTATLLPTTAFFLKTGFAPARKLLDSGARVALATDFNPGTSPTQDLSLVCVLSALQMGMRPEEIIAGFTINGAYALGLQRTHGALMAGYEADFVALEADSPTALFYQFGCPFVARQVFKAGKLLR